MGNIDINAEFERIGELLENEDFDGVFELCDELVSYGYDIPEVFLVRLLAETGSRNMNGLRNSAVILEECQSYTKVINTSDEKTCNYIKKCNDLSKKNARSILTPDYLGFSPDSNDQIGNRNDSRRDIYNGMSHKHSNEMEYNESAKGKKRHAWVWCIIVAFVILVPILLVLGNNGFVLSKVSYSLENGGVKCLFMHEFDKSDCTTGKVCKNCGVEIGKAPGHKWKEATCSLPKTCKQCGETEGDALGHAITDGKCSVCGEDLSELINAGEQIRTELEEVYTAMADALEWLENGLSNPLLEDSCKTVARNSFSDARFDLLDAKGISEKYPEFEKITKNLGYAHDALEVSYLDSILTYSNCGMDCFGYLQIVENELNNLIGEK